MPNFFYLIEILCAVIFYSTIIQVRSYRALLWALSFSAVVAAISSIAGGMQGDSLSGAFVMAFGIVFILPLVLGGLVGSFVAWLVLKICANMTSNSGRVFLVIMGMLVTVLVSAHGFYGQLYAGKTTCSDEARGLGPEKAAHIKIGNLDLTVPPDQRKGLIWLMDKSSFLFGEVDAPKVLDFEEFNIFACDLTKGFNRPIDAGTIKFSTTFTPQYEIRDDTLGNDMEYEEWSEAYGIEFMSTDLEISTRSYIASDMLELEGIRFWGYPAFMGCWSENIKYSRYKPNRCEVRSEISPNVWVDLSFQIDPELASEVVALRLVSFWENYLKPFSPEIEE